MPDTKFWNNLKMLKLTMKRFFFVGLLKYKHIQNARKDNYCSFPNNWKENFSIKFSSEVYFAVCFVFTFVYLIIR